MTDDPVTPIARSFKLDDLVVRTDGDGRTIEAYAAVFDTPTEIRDQFGHYIETIDRTAFNVALNRSKSKPRVLFNHGRDIYGNPSERFALPIGTPESIRPDGRGLRTVSRIANTQLGDEVLELIRMEAIDGFSFQGAPFESKTIAPKSRDDLPTIVRQRLGLTEYGPGVFVAYSEARILAVRTEQLVAEIEQLTPDQLDELVTVLRSRIPSLAPSAVDALIADGAGPHDDDRAAREFNHLRRLMAARLRGLTPHDRPAVSS